MQEITINYNLLDEQIKELSQYLGQNGPSSLLDGALDLLIDIHEMRPFPSNNL